MDESEQNLSEAKPKKRIKPDIEGINAPNSKKTIYIKPTFSSQDLLPDDSEPARIVTKKIAERAGQPSHGLRNFFIGLAILVLFLGGAFWGWQLYRNKSEQGILAVVEKTHEYNKESSAQYPEAATNQNTVFPENISTSTASSTYASDTVLSASSTQVSGGTSANLKKLKVTQTPTNYLNVREIPSTSGKQLVQIYPGEIYSYVTVQNGWYQIVLPNGSHGWVSGQYVVEE